jgi:hypothetical protein
MKPLWCAVFQGAILKMTEGNIPTRGLHTLLCFGAPKPLFCSCLGLAPGVRGPGMMVHHRQPSRGTRETNGTARWTPQQRMFNGFAQHFAKHVHTKLHFTLLRHYPVNSEFFWVVAAAICATILDHVHRVATSRPTL